MNNTINYKGYTASMVFDSQDKIIVGRVMDISDIISFHGESVSEFEAIFHAVIDDYIVACAKLGEQTGKASQWQTYVAYRARNPCGGSQGGCKKRNKLE